MKRIVVLFLLMATLLSAFCITTSAGDDNATGGDGSTHPATEGSAWYNSYQYLYKVTIYVGKKDTANKQSSLTNDFYRIGTVIVKKTGWDVSSSIMFGNATKVDYYSGTPMTRLQNPYIISDDNCPRIPIICSGGDIDIVKQYFGSTGTMNTLLNAIAAKEGNTAYGLLKNKSFTIGGVTKSGWAAADLLPNGTTNKVPWVIIYEPIIVIHLKDKVNMVAFTATEYAIAYANGWYDWRKSDGAGQNVARVTERQLPSSIQLEESWFGYPVYPVHDDTYRWEVEDIIKGGGWGMRWLGASADNGIDLSVEFLEYDPAPIVKTSVNHKIKWCNNKNTEQTVLCEIYSGDYLVTSYTLTIPGNSYIIKNTRITYNATRTHKMIAKINYANRYSETNPNNNSSTVTVIPKSSDTPAIDYGTYFGGVEVPEPNSYGQVEVTWKNYKQDFGTVLCELYRGSTLIWSGYKSFEGYEAIKETFSVYYPGTAEQTLTAKINYANRFDETDPNDNMRQRTVQPVAPVDSTYDFSVSNITVNPATVYCGDYVTVSFNSDNWNEDLAYSNILVELLVGGEVVKSDYVSFTPYGRNYHSYQVRLTDVGDQPIAARINWENRYTEDNATNNYTSTIATVNPKYDFAVSELSVSPNITGKGEIVSISFRTDNNDDYNSYTNIPVQLIYDGKVVYTEYFSYSANSTIRHTVNLIVGDQPGEHSIYARVNWQDHLNEMNIYNNETETAVVTVVDTADLWIESVIPDSDYRAGTQVITSFIMHNDSAADVIPSSYNTVTFNAYYYDGDRKIDIDSLYWNKAVIPAGDKNLVYFRWTVPKNAAGKKVYAEATVNAKHSISEANYENNSGRVVKTVIDAFQSTTPETRYERQAPSDFIKPVTPSSIEGYATWSIWEYINGSFVKKNYGIELKAVDPLIEPDPDDPSASDWSRVLTIKSGYGVYLKYTPSFIARTGYTLADKDAFTEPQTAYATFPEFQYLSNEGKCKTLEKVSGKWVFQQDFSIEDYDRLHFTPLWYPDGDYVISVTVSDMWTPAGMITARGNAPTIKISGSAYDDWYLGR